MRRLLSLAAFLLISSMMPVYAQHGGHGGGGGGSHGGFSGGGHAAFNAGAHAGSGGHVAIGNHSRSGGFAGSQAGFSGGSHFGPGTRPGFGPRGFRRNGLSGHGFRRRWGGGYPYYGYPYWGYYDPFFDPWWWGSGSSYDDQDYAQQQMADQMNQENLEEQQMLDQQDQDAYAPQARRDPQPSREETARNDRATVLVYRNGQRREIQNYAIVDGMLFNFSESRTERIPLAVLDIPATVRANDERGVDFHLPGTGEGQ